jgi:endonuclease/exonuclease/phosphatase family metal-dependent hydrolase
MGSDSELNLFAKEELGDQKPMNKLIFIVLLLVSSLATVAQPLTVLTYNINHGSDLSGRTNLIRIGRIIRESNADLISLQEIDSATVASLGKDQLQQLANLTGFYPIFGSTETQSQGGKTGLGILSRYPIIAHQHIPLPDPDQTGSRALLCAYIELPNHKTVRFCNSQFDDKLERGRGIQAGVVSTVLKPSIQPVIWTGDFNALPDEALLPQLRQYWFDAGWDTDTPTLPAAAARTDYVLTRPGGPLTPLAYQVLAEEKTAQHWPVVVRYRLK